MEIINVLQRSQLLVKELSEGLNIGSLTFEQVEKQILNFIYDLGRTIEGEILGGLEEPTVENSLRVGERTAVYAGVTSHVELTEEGPGFSHSAG
jgi:hypothetical protein